MRRCEFYVSVSPEEKTYDRSVAWKWVSEGREVWAMDETTYTDAEFKAINAERSYDEYGPRSTISGRRIANH